MAELIVPKSESPKNLALRIFDFISSMPTAIFLLCMVAGLSVIGTVLEQNQPSDFYLSKLGPFWYKVFAAMGLYNMYASWWFIGILAFLVLSVSIALVRFGPRVWRQMQPLAKVPDWPGDAATMEVAGEIAAAQPDQVRGVLHQAGFREFVRGRDGEGNELLVARKGRWAKIGFFLVHGGVVIIAVGGLVTSHFGFRGVMNIPTKDSADIVYVQDGSSYREIKLPFEVRNNQFAIDYYHTGMPSDYRTDLALVGEGGKVLASKRITVNDPLTYKGITFYQASFGDAGSAVSFVLTDLTKPNFPQQLVHSNVDKQLGDEMGNKINISELRQHNVVNMSQDAGKQMLRDVGPSLDVTLQSPANGTITYRVYQLYPNMLAYARMGDKDMTYDDLGFSPGDGKMMALLAGYLKQLEQSGAATPDARRAAFAAAMKEQGVPADRAAELGPVIAHAADVLRRDALPMLFSFSDFTPKMYTGLQVARDPGSPLIWIGSIMLILGLAVMMYMPELRLWVRFLQSGGDATLQLCGKSAGRSEMGVELLLERLCRGLKTGVLPA